MVAHFYGYFLILCKTRGGLFMPPHFRSYRVTSWRCHGICKLSWRWWECSSEDDQRSLSSPSWFSWVLANFLLQPVLLARSLWPVSCSDLLSSCDLERLNHLGMQPSRSQPHFTQPLLQMELLWFTRFWHLGLWLSKLLLWAIRVLSCWEHFWVCGKSPRIVPERGE